jgi:hypothetical protein
LGNGLSGSKWNRPPSETITEDQRSPVLMLFLPKIQQGKVIDQTLLALSLGPFALEFLAP